MLRLVRDAVRCARPFRVLAIESSADDTCAAVVDSARRILSNVVVRQNHLHLKTNGIHPLIAMHAHQRNMPAAVKKALTDANLAIADVDGIAFTRGPGLPGSLSVACSAAKTLAAVNNLPLVGVHHMQAHALTVNLTLPPQFPCLTLLVSGGHTMLVLATSLVDFRILATTADKSIGSILDRGVTILAVPWSHLGPGPGLEAYCAAPVPDEGGAPPYDPPNAMPGQLAFSFTGLHSWLERTVHAAGGIAHVVHKRALARAFQRAAFAHLETKLRLALKWCENKDYHVRRVVVSGGVASNLLLRQRLKACLSPFEPIELVFPDPALCTDNAVMIAWASMHRFLAHDHDDYGITPLPSWSIQDIQNPPDVDPLPN